MNTAWFALACPRDQRNTRHHVAERKATVPQALLHQSNLDRLGCPQRESCNRQCRVCRS
jgi:hypothetical protein